MDTRMKHLNYPGRDIRVLPSREGVPRDPDPQPKLFGDFDPNPDTPDPDIRPLEEYDPSYPASTRNLIRISNSYPTPHVTWMTEEYLTKLYNYNPVRQSLDVEEPPPWDHPDSHTTRGTVDVLATNESSRTLTRNRRKALTRIARLWNSEVVRSHHLLRDKPSFDTRAGR